MNISARINYELDPEFRLGVLVTSGETEYQLTLNIDIYDVNEQLKDIRLDKRQVAENLAVGADVGRLTSRDPDIGQQVTYSIINEVRIFLEMHVLWA